MKILIATPFYPPDVGGIAYHVFNIARHLSKRHELTIVKNDKDYGITVNKGIKVVKIPSFNPSPYPYQTISSFRIPLTAWKLGEIIKNEKIDLVHAHGHHYPITWLSIFYAKKYGKLTILTLHGMYALNPHVTGGKTLLEEVFNNLIFRSLLKKTDTVIGLTKSIVSYARKYGTKKTKYYVIPNGVDLDLYNKNLHRKIEYRIKYGLPLDKIIVLFRGRFTYVKGVLEAAYAAKSVENKKSNLFFLFVGEGPLKYAVKKILSDLKNVKILSWTPQETIHELYIASDVYLLPSKWEALPITLIEAMAARLYIISTLVGGINDVLHGYPLSIAIKDTKYSTIAKALLKVAHENFKVYEVERYIEQFDWKSITNRIENNAYTMF